MVEQEDVVTAAAITQAMHHYTVNNYLSIYLSYFSLSLSIFINMFLYIYLYIYIYLSVIIASATFL